VETQVTQTQHCMDGCEQQKASLHSSQLNDILLAELLLPLLFTDLSSSLRYRQSTYLATPDLGL
jgi:hypothetical protein